MYKLSFVYFDVGGVLINDFSDSDKWAVMMADMGVKPQDIPRVDAIYDPFEIEVCLGQHHVDEIIPRLIKEFHLSLPPNFSMQSYFIDHFQSNPGILSIVTKLHQISKIGLLTAIYPQMLNEIFRRQLIPQSIWDVVIDSSVEHLTKPMPEIYDLAQSRAGVPAEEILFIDNREKNLVIPRKLGWQTFLYDSSNYDQANKDLSVFLQL